MRTVQLKFKIGEKVYVTVDNLKPVGNTYIAIDTVNSYIIAGDDIVISFDGTTSNVKQDNVFDNPTDATTKLLEYIVKYNIETLENE